MTDTARELLGLYIVAGAFIFFGAMVFLEHLRNRKDK